MKRKFLFLTILGFYTMLSFVCNAQVEITYEKVKRLPDASDDPLMHMEISQQPVDSIPPVADSVSENTLKYGWIDIDFLIQSVTPLSEKRADVQKRFDELNNKIHELYNLNGNNAASEIQRLQEESQVLAPEFFLNVYNYCLTPSIELGYIPLMLYNKEEAVGDKMANLPDITWQLGNAMKKKLLTPYNSDQLGKANMKIAYVTKEMIDKRLDIPFSEVNSLIYAYCQKRGADNYIQGKSKAVDDIRGEIYQLVLNSIKSKFAAWDYDGIIIVNPQLPYSPVVLEGMDDVTYLVLTQCMTEDIMSGYRSQIESICQLLR